MTADARILNLTVDLAGVILCAVAILQVALSKTDRRTRRYFVLFYIGMLLLSASNMAGLLMKGLPGPAWRAALYAANYTEFLMPTVLAYLITDYLLSIVDPLRERRGLRGVLLAVLLLDIAALTVSQFTGWYYVIDADNVYRRAAAYPASYLGPLIIMAIYAFLTLRHRKRLTQKERIAFCIYFIVPAFSIPLQNLQYGINFAIFSILIAGIVMYVFLLQDQTDRYYLQEKENARLQTELMLSQIQPHFLYNSLTVIQDLCRTDPAQAEAATIRFAKYLRGNMDSLRADTPVPFTRELEHTREYLELEKMRFEDKLTVRYDIRCEDFQLPTLTLQPIAENAVRHGVRGNSDGRGEVVISTREYPDRYQITVTDNGPGFAPNPPRRDPERSHVGIPNVRERIAQMCGGSLTVRSAPGEGTAVTITLPKEANIP